MVSFTKKKKNKHTIGVYYMSSCVVFKAIIQIRKRLFLTFQYTIVDVAFSPLLVHRTVWEYLWITGLVTKLL